jgi:ribosomal protein S5
MVICLLPGPAGVGLYLGAVVLNVVRGAQALDAYAHHIACPGFCGV